MPVPRVGHLVIVSGGKGVGGEPLVAPGHQQSPGKELSDPSAYAMEVIKTNPIGPVARISNVLRLTIKTDVSEF